MIEIEIKQRRCPSPNEGKLIFELLTEQRAVWKICQWVIMSELGDFGFGRLSLCHIVNNRQKVLRRTAFVEESSIFAEDAPQGSGWRHNVALIE